MKILIVDYLAHIGHIGYNQHHIEILKQMCNDITYISSAKQVRLTNVDGIKELYFPDRYFKPCSIIPRNILLRIQDLLKLVYLRRILKKDQYDKVVFMSYDIMATGFITFKEECILIAHMNVDGLKYKLKLYLTKKLPSNYKFITLAEYIQNFMQSVLPQKDIYLVPHGLTKIYKNDHYQAPFGINRFIYCPISSSCDENIFFKIVLDEKVQDYLTENGITLIIKSNIQYESIRNCKILTSYIDEPTYCNLMLCSIAVFAPYDTTFNNRISGVLMECIGNNIPIISCPSSACFKYAKKYTNYKMLVQTPHEFIETLNEIEEMKGKQYYRSTEDFDAKPYWEGLIKD